MKYMRIILLLGCNPVDRSVLTKGNIIVIMAEMSGLDKREIDSCLQSIFESNFE